MLLRNDLKDSEALQETLDELNDIAVGSEMHTSDAAEALHQEQLTRVDDLRATAQAQHQDLATLEPFWKS
jgi:triphosphatase